MKLSRLPVFSFLAVTAILLAVWAIHTHFNSRLSWVEVRRPNGEFLRTEDPDFLRKMEVWRHSVEGPSLRQRLLRLTGRWCESGLRQADYQVTLVFNNGRREELAVWVYSADYVPVHCEGYGCLARSEPFTGLTQALPRNEVSDPVADDSLLASPGWGSETKAGR
jgi:hypothetical protein